MLESLPSQTVQRMLPKLAKLLGEVVSEIPSSDKKKSPDPRGTSRDLAAAAAMQTAAMTGALALPPGPIGVLTMVPDLVIVWRRQAKLVADIAAVHGKTEKLTRELMMYCLFRHVSADAVKDIVVRAGQRVIVTRTSVVVFYRVVRLIVGDMLALVAGRFLLRWLPFIGAASVAAYCYRDTIQVGETAVEAFGGALQNGAKRKHSK